MARELIVMLPEHKQILNELKKVLEGRLKHNLKKVILFGSQLTGNANTNSDFDILIIVKEKPDWKLERLISDLCYEIDLKYNIITDTHILSEADLESLRGKQPVFENALSRGIAI